MVFPSFRQGGLFLPLYAMHPRSPAPAQPLSLGPQPAPRSASSRRRTFSESSYSIGQQCLQRSTVPADFGIHARLQSAFVADFFELVQQAWKVVREHDSLPPTAANPPTVTRRVFWSRRLRLECERAGLAGAQVLDMLVEVELVEQGDAFGH